MTISAIKSRNFEFIIVSTIITSPKVNIISIYITTGACLVKQLQGLYAVKLIMEVVGRKPKMAGLTLLVS